ncbi:NLR family member X1-like [Scleropages formosus]|uniref:NLR family member X1-like n=1 Tax=Scleropages formosus TaxID=113540 RepID=A0A0P7TVD2_SCLFO|nr:NLR family member X1-like [Scleropages formosus]
MWLSRRHLGIGPLRRWHGKCQGVSSETRVPNLWQDPIEIHKDRLTLWFSHLPQEEKQFGGYFSSETMHVEPLILERKPAESRGVQKAHISYYPSLSMEQLFETSAKDGAECGLNVLMYGAVGTGKSTAVRKLVLDWCSGSILSQFKLVIPFSCEDLFQSTKPTSLRDLVGKKYLHLRRTPYLSGEGHQARDVLFIFNGMERMKLNFRIASTELCSDPNEPLPTWAIMVNLLRKYLLPEASILVTTRLSAVDHIPKKYVDRYVQICGFNNPDRQRSYFTSRLLQQSAEKLNPEAESLIELLYLNLQRESQLAAACFLPSYCWLTCATLHFLHFTDTQAPIRTLTGIYTSFLRLNFGGEVLEAASSSTSDQQTSLMLYVVRTVGKLAFDGVKNKRTRFSEEELEQWVGGKTKTDEELQQLAVFRTDVLAFFLVPCVESIKPQEAGEEVERRYVFAVPAMQEYLAALYVVLGENKTLVEKLSREVSQAVGQAGEDLTSLVTILSKFIPIRIFAIFNLLRLVPSLFERIINLTKGRIARTMAAEMFRSEDSFNEDVLDQVEQSLLGVQGPAPQQQSDQKPFELYPIFMGGLLHYGNRALLEQLGCRITSTVVSQITHALSRYLVRESRKAQPPAELMDLLVFLYEFQNPRLTAQVLGSLRVINLSTVRMTPLKCFVLSSVLSCTPPRHLLNELNLSSCHLTQELLEMLRPAFLRTRRLKLCDNELLESGAKSLLEALPENRSLRRLDLMHTGLGDSGAIQLAEKLSSHSGLEELNVAYNQIGDTAALHLYLNQLSEVGKQSLYINSSTSGSSHKVKVLASVTEGADLSKDWHPILSVIRENATSWERARVCEQLRIFLRELELGRRQQYNILKKLHFLRVERGVRACLRMLESGSPKS